MKNEKGETCDFVRLAFDATWNTYQAKKRKSEATSGIYGLVDPREPNRVRYVGSSCCIENRLYAHVVGDATRRHARGVWLQRLKTEGVTPQALVLERTEVGPAGDINRHRAEATWIERFVAREEADLNSHLLPGRNRSRELREENEALRRQVAALQREVERLTSTEDLV